MGNACRRPQKGVSVVNSSKMVKRRKEHTFAPPVMSMSDLAKLGGGKVAYIKVMSPDEAKEMFPAVEGIPAGINLYALHAADGTPLALTDSHQAAVGHALGDELEIASLH
jgi:hypothetical protein